MKAHITFIFSRFALMALLAVLTGTTVHTTPVNAGSTSIVVNSNLDANNSKDGVCTLREAIIAANNGYDHNECKAGLDTNTITFAGNYTINVGSGETDPDLRQLPFVTGTITIIGNGPANTIIQAAAPPETVTWRIFQVTSLGSLTLNQVTLRNGHCNGSCTIIGGIYPDTGGGIYNAGTLTIMNSTISENIGYYGSGIFNTGNMNVINSIVSGNTVYSTNVGSGGGIYNSGTLTVTNSTFSGNKAVYGGGIANADTGILTIASSTFSNNVSYYNSEPGGAIGNSGTLDVTNSTFLGNSARLGGGIYNTGSMTVRTSTFSGNNATRFGCGVYNGADGSIVDSTFSGNANSSAHGGGILNSSNLTVTGSTFSANNSLYGGGVQNNGTLNVTNSTFWNNAAYYYGGGIENNGTLTVTNSTFSGNGSNSSYGGGIYNSNSSTATLKNSIVANNSGGNCYGTITNGGNNLDGGTTCSWGATNGSSSNTDPMLGALASNGGLTQTMALLSGSPAINKGNDATCPSTDQRGVGRPQGTHCDIGAYEKESLPLPTGWVGGVSISADRNIVAIARPHVGSEVASYDGFPSGSLSVYVPMLFNNAYGSYNAALYVQNVHPSSTADIMVKYYDNNGILKCTQAGTIAPLSSVGYWMPSVTCNSGSLPDGWVGGAVVTSNQPIVAVGRPHVGGEVMTYGGFTAGSTTLYIPMLFNNSWGSYNSAFYLQNANTSSTAQVTINFYDDAGNLKCKKVESIAPLASKGYWVPSTTCDNGSLPDGWVGGVVVSSNQPIVGVGRPHIGGQVTTYKGFTAGSLTSYIPMLFKNAWSSYNSAFYIQNTNTSNWMSITIKYYDSSGTQNCMKQDSIAPLASKGYWVPSVTCLPDGWVGGVAVTSNQAIVGVGRPHIVEQVTTYNGLITGSRNSYLPMLFKEAWGSYNSAFYIQNTEANAANVTIKFYDTSGVLTCTRTDSIPALSTLGYWVPSVMCDP